MSDARVSLAHSHLLLFADQVCGGFKFAHFVKLLVDVVKVFETLHNFALFLEQIVLILDVFEAARVQEQSGLALQQNYAQPELREI